MKPNKQNIINDILIELEKGIGYKDCLVVIGIKWKLPPTTYSRYWKTANEQYKIKQDLIQKELLITSTEAQKERLKKAILSKDEILEKLTEIANEAFSNSKDGTNIDYNNRINAIKVLVDILGLKAPTNTNVSISTVKPLEVVRIEPIQRE